MVRSPRLVFSACLLFALIAAGCGGDDDDNGADPAPGDGTQAATMSAGTEGGPEPDLEAPATRYSLELADMPAGYLVNTNRTFLLDAAGYGMSSVFADDEEGARMLNEWGYVGGYETEFQPEKREVGVLEGSNYVFVESHLFEDTDGAQSFYDHLHDQLEAGPAQEVNLKGLANESSAWRLERDNVPGSDIPAAYSWYLFRRGNLVSAVKVYGAASFVTSESSRALAVTIDQRALGELPVVGEDEDTGGADEGEEEATASPTP